MARKPLTTIDWMQQNVDEIFAEPLKEIESSNSKNTNVHEKIEQFERKARLNFNKSRAAPPPPGTKIHLPKIGNYKPKILLSRSSSKAEAPKSPYEDVEIPLNLKVESHVPQEEKQKHPLHTERQTPSNSECNKFDDSDIYHTIEPDYDRTFSPDYDKTFSPDYVKTEERKVMIIGDKDTPLVLGNSFINEEDVIDNNNEVKNTENIDSVVSKNELNESELFTETNTVINIGEVVENPLFEDSTKEPAQTDSNDLDTPRHPYKKRRAPSVPSSYINRHRHSSSHASDDEFPYIPEPDYEEEEATINFDGVLGKDMAQAKRRDQKVIKDYEGEDFAKYMDEDEGFVDHTFTWRKNIRHARKPQQQKPKSAPNVKYSERSAMNAPKLKPMKKSKHTETHHESFKRQTLRDITYADCKMGVDDRTVRSVKSTTAGGRYVKRGKERTMIVDGDPGAGGYEEFLRMRHKGDGSLESNSSGDSGHETGDDYYHHEQYFHNMQPKQLRDKHEKGSIWQKLTWRFKRHVGGYKMT